nr:MAG TPA: hypothetical protein [Caudoviricetes sp.]
MIRLIHLIILLLVEILIFYERPKVQDTKH